MSCRSIQLLKAVRKCQRFVGNLSSLSVNAPVIKYREKSATKSEYKTENNLIYYEDPDNFGTLSRQLNLPTEELQDEGDLKEEQFLQYGPLPSMKLTTKQYADLIKQYLKHKRLKQAIDVLEVRMKQDRVQPENYIYNILIGGCADVGYTKKAFKLYNDMKRRALNVTGDTYTCLFNACANSPWAADGLKHATQLRALMQEKGIEPNLTNYNVMIKAFGRCGDLSTAFQIVDEMRSKRIKIRVHTFNFLLQSCITDKSNGLRHALVVWRYMLKMREKPNIFSFNLMLKCVKECNIGSKNDIQDLIDFIKQNLGLTTNTNIKLLSSESNVFSVTKEPKDGLPKEETKKLSEGNPENKLWEDRLSEQESTKNLLATNSEMASATLQLVEKPKSAIEKRKVPNLLSKLPQMQEVLDFKEVTSLQEKFAIIGGEADFLKEMATYSVKPDIKTFTQMLHLLEDTEVAENMLMNVMKEHNVKADIDFYNMLIKKRCLRSDYDAAFAVREIINGDNKIRKKKHPMKKKLILKLNIITYGVLAMGCNTKEKAETLLQEMKEKGLK